MNNVTNPPWSASEEADYCVITAPTDAKGVRYIVARGLTRSDARFITCIWDLARALRATARELETHSSQAESLEQAYAALEAIDSLDGVGPYTLDEHLDPRRGEEPIADDE